MKRKNKQTKISEKKKKTQEEQELKENCSKVQPTITADELYDSIIGISKKSWKKWTEEEKQKIIQKMKCRASINLQNSKKESIETYDEFYGKWEDFLNCNEEIKKLIDPWYICFSFNGNTQSTSPQNWGNSINDYNQRPNIQPPQIVNNSDFLYAFTSKYNACCFGYFMVGKHNVTFSVFESHNMEFR